MTYWTDNTTRGAVRFNRRALQGVPPRTGLPEAGIIPRQIYADFHRLLMVAK